MFRGIVAGLIGESQGVDPSRVHVEERRIAFGLVEIAATYPIEGPPEFFATAIFPEGTSDLNLAGDLRFISS